MKPYRPLKPLAKPKTKVKAVKARSSTVRAFSYLPDKKQLDVEFHSGRKYRYSGVPAEIHEGLKAANSKGSFLHSSIIGKFDTTKL